MNMLYDMDRPFPVAHDVKFGNDGGTVGHGNPLSHSARIVCDCTGTRGASSKCGGEREKEPHDGRQMKTRFRHKTQFK